MNDRRKQGKIVKHTNKIRSAIFRRLHYIFDIVMFFVSLAAAVGLLMFHKAETTDNQNHFVHLTASSKNKNKKTEIPKSQLAIGEAYELIPKKRIKRYKTIQDAYGDSYRKKLKRPKITYLDNFYLAHNYASKDTLVKDNLYIPLNGCVTALFKTPQAGQYNFVNSDLGFNSLKHYVLNDSHKYIQVMQFKNYAKYGKFAVPNVTNNTLKLTLNAGSNRYLKLNEFTIKRVNSIDLSQKAQQLQLFGGYSV